MVVGVWRGGVSFLDLFDRDCIHLVLRENHAIPISLRYLTFVQFLQEVSSSNTSSCT